MRPHLPTLLLGKTLPLGVQTQAYNHIQLQAKLGRRDMPSCKSGVRRGQWRVGG